MDKTEIKENYQASLTAYDINKQIITKQPPLLFEDNKKKLLSKVRNVVLNDVASKYYVLMSPNFSYLTIFTYKDETNPTSFSKGIVLFLEEEIKSGSLGKLKDFENVNDNTALELWLGDECYYLFSYKNGVVEL